jgi:tetratricopeptide (TPR) repeat protein
VQQGDLEAALDPLLARLAQAPPDGHEARQIREALARGFMERGLWPAAIDCANELCPTPTQPRPENPRYLFLRGLIWEKVTEQFEPHVAEQHALADFSRAVELAPKWVEARAHLAGMLYQAGHPLEAAAHFECARGCRPESPEVLLGLARCRVALAQPDVADQILETLTIKYPDHWAGLLERGRLTFHQGQYAVAEECLRRAAAAAPPYAAEPYRLLGFVLRAENQESAARQVKEKEDSVEAANLRVDVLSTKAKKPGADAALCCEVARDQMELGRPQAGASWYLSALQVDPHYGPAHQALADYFERVGQTSRAARHRQAAQEATP